MTDELTSAQREYAGLVIREGVNLTPGQKLLIRCPLERADFARLCAEAAYDAGAEEVLFLWEDDALIRMKYLRAADAVFDRAAPWETGMLNDLSAEGACQLAIVGEDPDRMQGVDPGRIRRARAVRGRALEPFRERQTRNEIQWCVCAAPTCSWAQKVFPALTGDRAVERLWEEILRACRVRAQGSVEAWRAHSAALQRHVETLNALRLRSLHYSNALGTELTVDLPEDHYWAGGAERCIRNGIYFSANLPTEEVFTLPRRDGVAGVVYASKPLVLDGTVIEGLRFVLREGRITEVSARTGEKVLRDATATDAGASYLGEVALVPWDSPISQSGVLFYETLFDENAACHFAFGDAYPCIRGAESMDREQLLARGVNSSMIHVDFMVGTPDLSILGTTEDGKQVPIFTAGTWHDLPKA